MSYCRKTFHPFVPKTPKPHIASRSTCSSENTSIKSTKEEPSLMAPSSTLVKPSAPALASTIPRSNNPTPLKPVELSTAKQNSIPEVQNCPISSTELSKVTVTKTIDTRQEKPQPDTAPTAVITPTCTPVGPDADETPDDENIPDYISIPESDEEDESDGSEYAGRSGLRDMELAKTYHEIWASKPATNSGKEHHQPKGSRVVTKRKRKSNIKGYCKGCKWRNKRCSADGGPGPCQQCKDLSELRGGEVPCVYDPDFIRTQAIKAGQRLPECYFSRPGVRKRPRVSLQGSRTEEQERPPENEAAVPVESSSEPPPERPVKRFVLTVKRVDGSPVLPIDRPQAKVTPGAEISTNAQKLPSPPTSVITKSISQPVSATATSDNVLEPIEAPNQPGTINGTILPSIQVRNEFLSKSSTGNSSGVITTDTSQGSIAEPGKFLTSSPDTSSDSTKEYAPIHDLVENLKEQIDYCTKLKEHAAEGDNVRQTAEMHIARLNRNLDDKDLKKHLEVEKVALSGRAVPEWMRKGFIDQNVEDFKKKREWGQ